MSNQLSNHIYHAVRNFLRNHNDEERFVNDVNQGLEHFTGYKLHNRRNRNRFVNRFSKSTSPTKVIVRYSDGTSSTMLIKNVLNNLISLEIDLWEEMDEDQEQELMLQRMGINV